MITRIRIVESVLNPSSGVAVLAVGIGRADQEELRRAVTGGRSQNVLYVQDANDLYQRHPELAELLCGLARAESSVSRTLVSPKHSCH